MASPGEVLEGLELIWATYHVRAHAREQMQVVWTMQFAQTPASAYLRAVTELIGSEDDFRRVTPAKLHHIIRDSSLRGTSQLPRGCEHCGAWSEGTHGGPGSGTRTLWRKYHTPSGQQCRSYVAACNCARGQVLQTAGTPLPVFSAVVDAWRDHPDTLGWWVTDQQNGPPPLEWQLTAEALAALKPGRGGVSKETMRQGLRESCREGL